MTRWVSFALGNPIKFTDPSGHDPIINNCDYGGVCSPVIFFGGSNPQNSKLKGPSPFVQSPVWTTGKNGEPIAEIPYPGGNSAKVDQASYAEGVLSNESVDLIGYSGGTESALMYATWRLKNDQKVNSVALLGPTFETSTMNFNEPDGGWSVVIDNLLINGVDVYVLDDGRNIFDPNFHNAAFSYKPPSGATGSWKYDQRWMQHYSRYPNWDLGTNNSKNLKQNVYNWVSAE